MKCHRLLCYVCIIIIYISSAGYFAYAYDTQQLISLNFQNIKIRSVLQILAKITHSNIVASDNVRGNITVHFNNIPWQKALDIILKTHGLDKIKINNILLIVPHNEQRIISEFEKLSTILVPINYANAKDIVALIKNNHVFLSKYGVVNYDKRLNAILVYDTYKAVTRIKKLIKQLDTPTKQVQIEARIVNMTKEAITELGIKFGMKKFNNIDSVLKSPNNLQHLNIDFGSVLTHAAVPGIAIAKMQHGILLDLELSALENENKVKIVANPKLMTTNKHTAIIESGEEIPYQEVNANGATSVAFKKAVLSLKVTPQITPDNKLLMHLEINQDTPSGRIINGVPAIITKSIQTNVLIDNLQTLVLGGIYRHDYSSNIVKLPLLGNLPLIGLLFRQQQHRIKNEELLIFITPRIIVNN